MTNHLAKVADLEMIGKDTVRKEAEQAIDEAISIFEQVCTICSLEMKLLQVGVTKW